ncbi:hypothetical protein GCM10010451_04770 [Streptomyces virens]|uniref:Uncharacterized protein n=1 Tax=Streptomyces virens TaxID=285572 RepID=A0ABP6NWA9_9ACTN|nr:MULTISPECIES: hypothetical protein [Streptomyces]MBA8975532.1 hypothetical protein [Streptomyces calvus]MYS31554.1 hypothetical protein [Streptomyces sp. SID7804]
MAEDDRKNPVRLGYLAQDNLRVTIDIAEFNAKAGPGLAALTALLSSGVAGHAPAPDDRRAFLVGWGLVAALHRQACAVVLLHDSGLGHEAAPNRRLMIEYVAHLQWLVRDGDAAVDSMNKAFQYKHTGLRKAADAGGYQYDANAADAVRDAIIPSNPSDEFNIMSKLLDRLGGGLLQSWLAETQLSHASLPAAQCFYRESGQAVQLFDVPTYNLDGDPMDASPYVAFFFLYFGMIAFNELMADGPWRSDLRSIGEVAGLAGAI